MHDVQKKKYITNRVIIRATTIPESLRSFCKGILKELSSWYVVIGVSSPGEALLEVAENEGIRVIPVPMERHISFAKDCMSLIRMFHVFRKEKPLMVHSMTPKAGLICMIAAWLARVPIRVHTFTGLVFPTTEGPKRWILMATDWLTCACSTHVIPEGEGVKSDLLNYGITRKPLKVLGHGNVRGIDMEYFSRSEGVIETAERLQLLDKTKVTFLYVGRVVRDKGINELVEAFSRLNHSIKHIRLFLVGPFEDSLDPIKDETRRIIRGNDAIISVGGKNGDELLAYYASADCFILPSYREGFPNTVLEAGAMGLPCIVTDVNGSREIIKNGINGIVVPPKSVEALYSAMEEMARSEANRQLMSSRARDMIGNRFEQGFVRKCLYDFYDEILEPYV